MTHYRVQYRNWLYRTKDPDWSDWADIELAEIFYTPEHFLTIEAAVTRRDELRKSFPNTQYRIVRIDLTPIEG